MFLQNYYNTLTIKFTILISRNILKYRMLTWLAMLKWLAMLTLLIEAIWDNLENVNNLMSIMGLRDISASKNVTLLHSWRQVKQNLCIQESVMLRFST